jgi:hypothetical protein
MQLVHDRALITPTGQLAAHAGVGARVSEPKLGLIRHYPFSARYGSGQLGGDRGPDDCHGAPAATRGSHDRTTPSLPVASGSSWPAVARASNRPLQFAFKPRMVLADELRARDPHMMAPPHGASHARCQAKRGWDGGATRGVVGAEKASAHSGGGPARRWGCGSRARRQPPSSRGQLDGRQVDWLGLHIPSDESDRCGHKYASGST